MANSLFLRLLWVLLDPASAISIHGRAILERYLLVKLVVNDGTPGTPGMPTSRMSATPKNEFLGSDLRARLSL